MKRNRGGRTGGLGGGTLATGSARRTRKFAERRAGGALLLVGSLALACSRDPEPEKAPEKPAGQEAQENGARRVSHAEDAKVMAEHHVAHETADGELEQMQHAFFLVGDAHPFLVHMTNMWMDAHLYQMVLRVKLPEAMWQAYVKDRESAGSEHWYIVGNVADDEMALPDLARGAKRSFRGSLWRSWPTTPTEDGAPWPWAKTPPVVADFEVQIERVVQYRHFDWNLRRPTSLTYFLFGEGEEAHMQSYQIKQPDFDHLLTLSAAPTWVAPALLEAGVHVNFPHIPPQPGPKRPQGTPDVYCEAPVGPGSHRVQLAGQTGERVLEIKREVFFGTYPVNADHKLCDVSAGDAKDASRGGVK